MTQISITKKQAKELLKNKLSHNFGVTPEEATYEHYYKALAMILRDILRPRNNQFVSEATEDGSKKYTTSAWNFSWGAR